MEIRRYLRILASRKWVVVLTAIVTLAVVTLGSFRMTRIYSASALVRVATGLNSSVTFADLNDTERPARETTGCIGTELFIHG